MTNLARGIVTLSTLILVLSHAPIPASAEEPCRIEITDRDSGWPVPLIELRTVSDLRFVSDNAGVIVVDAPELMNRETWFHVHGQGYGVQEDRFGFEGIRITPKPGETLKVEVERRVIAKRIGRLTGSGLFANHQRTASDELVAESGILGCDSVQMTEHEGRLFWVWGDSNLAHYPLGIFHASGATTTLAPLKSPSPPLAMPFEYFRNDKGQPRGVTNVPGRGPTWLTCLTSLPDASGDAHLVASYVKVEPPLTIWQRGLCEWNQETEMFEVSKELWTKGTEEAESPVPNGHATRWKDEEGVEWVLLGNPFPKLKFRATYEDWLDTESWESLDISNELTSVAGEPIRAHSGSIAYNSFRKKWVTIFVQAFGKPSALGEVWYAEANSPFGPWGPAVKVLSHQNYSFYNPRIQIALAANGSPHLFFEGTYTVLFANATRDGGLAPSFPNPTPRYDYNQILYRLDLDSDELAGARGE